MIEIYVLCIIDILMCFRVNDYTLENTDSKSIGQVCSLSFLNHLNSPFILSIHPGFVPSTELIRNLSGANKFLYRYVLHGMLRFIKMTKTIAQGGQAICNIVTDEKYKGL